MEIIDEEFSLKVGDIIEGVSMKFSDRKLPEGIDSSELGRLYVVHREGTIFGICDDEIDAKEMLEDLEPGWATISLLATALQSAYKQGFKQGQEIIKDELERVKGTKNQITV